MIKNLQFAIKTLLLLGFTFGATERTGVFMQDNLLVATELSQLILVVLCIVGVLLLCIND
jgi:hypothetical protein